MAWRYNSQQQQTGARPFAPLFVWVLSLCLLLVQQATLAQEGLNLPTDLYVLTNAGRVTRYGVGASGITEVTPEGQFVVDFAVTPDGQWLSYRTESALALTEVNTGNWRLVDGNPPLPPYRVLNDTVVWSPDARAFAYTTPNGARLQFRDIPPHTISITDSADGTGFTRLRWSPDGGYLAAENPSKIWQVYRVEREIVQATLIGAVPASLDILWLGEGVMVFAPTVGGLYRIDFALANAQTELLAPTRTYSALTLLDSGEIATLSWPTTPEAATTGRYTLVNPVRGRADVIGEADIATDQTRWAPNGELLVVFAGGGLALVNPINGSGFTLPLANVVTYGWGALSLPLVSGYALPNNLFFLAEDENRVAQLWQLPPDGGQPFPLTRATADLRGYQLAPDGYTLVYSSGGELWRLSLNSSEPAVPLVTLSADINAQAAFSPDGQTLAYADNGIWTVPTTGGTPTKLFENVYAEDNTRIAYHPRFAPNFAALLVDINYFEGSSSGMIDLNTRELLELPFGYLNATWLPDGRIMTFAPFAPDGAYSRPGVQITALTTLDSPTMVLPDSISVADAVWLPNRRRDTLRLLVTPGIQPEGPSPLSLYDYDTVAGLVPLYQGGFMTDGRFSPDGSMLAGYTRPSLAVDGTVQGQLSLLNINVGTAVALRSPASVWQVRWQGRR
ncbi:MAG: TolB family protein [Phototrophicaceae bacterium]|jgi:hypothetical protein